MWLPLPPTGRLHNPPQAGRVQFPATFSWGAGFLTSAARPPRTRPQGTARRDLLRPPPPPSPPTSPARIRTDRARTPRSWAGRAEWSGVRRVEQRATQHAPRLGASRAASGRRRRAEVAEWRRLVEAAEASCGGCRGRSRSVTRGREAAAVRV